MSVLYINFWGGVRDGLHVGFISNVEIDFSGGEDDVTIPGTAGTHPLVAEMYTDADCHWVEGATGTNAATSDRFLAQGERMSYWVKPGRDLSVIGA